MGKSKQGQMGNEGFVIKLGRDVEELRE